MLACVGAANSLASPARLLASVPAALYEVGVAVVVAMTFAPAAGRRRRPGAHRATAARTPRPRAARACRVRRCPVLEGALERAVDLAAAMDSRGYGRTGPMRRRLRLDVDGAPARRAASAICLGVYGLLDAGTPGALGLPLLVLGVVAGGRRHAARRPAQHPHPLPARPLARCPSGWRRCPAWSRRSRSSRCSITAAASVLGPDGAAGVAEPAAGARARRAARRAARVRHAAAARHLAASRRAARPHATSRRWPRDPLRGRLRRYAGASRAGARPRRPARPRGRARARRRSHRQRQVDAAALRQRPGAALHRRHAVGSRHRRRPRHPHAPAARARRRRRRRPAGPAAPASSPTWSRTSSPTAWSRSASRPTSCAAGSRRPSTCSGSPTCATARCARCPAASASASRSAPCSRCTRTCSSSTSRRRRSIPVRPKRCSPRCSGSCTTSA